MKYGFQKALDNIRGLLRSAKEARSFEKALDEGEGSSTRKAPFNRVRNGSSSTFSVSRFWKICDFFTFSANENHKDAAESQLLAEKTTVESEEVKSIEKGSANFSE
jgi:hypothetical protein